MKNSPRIIVVTSGKGGVGKTSVTAHLGRALARLGAKTVLLDIDIGLNNLDVLMDIENKIVFDLIDVIESRCRLKQALITDAAEPNLCVLPSAHAMDKSRINGQNIRAVALSLAASFEYIILDCPAGIDIGFHRAVAAANEALVVVTPHISSIRDADKVIQLLKAYKLDSVRLVINRARGDLILKNQMVGIDGIKTLLKTDVAGVVPEDDAVNLLSNFGACTKKKTDGQRAFETLAKNIMLNTAFEFDIFKKHRGLFRVKP